MAIREIPSLPQRLGYKFRSFATDTYLVRRATEFLGAITATGGITGDITGNVTGDVVATAITETVNTVASSGTTETLDISAATVHDVTLDDNCTFTFSNPAASGSASSFLLILRQDATGSRLATWPASVDWPSATAPTLSTGGTDVDIFSFVTVDGGTTWLGVTTGLDIS